MNQQNEHTKYEGTIQIVIVVYIRTTRMTETCFRMNSKDMFIHTCRDAHKCVL